MPDFAIVLFIIVLVLLALMLIGHGLWVFLAFAFRGFQARKVPQQTCGFCGKKTPLDSQDCQWCCRDLNSPLAKELCDLQVVARQLRRMQYNGYLKPEAAENLLKRVKEYRELLIQPHTQPKKAAIPEKTVKAPPVIEQVSAVEPLVAEEVVEEKNQILEQILVKPQAAEMAQKLPVAKTIAMPQAAKEVAKPKPAPASARPPRKSFVEVLGSFLEERDIHWTELTGVLLGGLLMIAGSLMFVIVYWHRLESTVKFSIFVGYSLMVFVAGLFALHRWKLQATGRGLLTIGILLAPLNFLAMASGHGSLSMAIVEFLGLAAFAWLVMLAAKALTRDGQWPMVAVVIGNSVLILLVGQLWHDAALPVLWMFFGLLAAGLFTGPVIWHLQQVGGGIPEISKGHEQTAKAENSQTFNVLQTVNSLFIMLAVAAYCSAISLAFIAAQASHVGSIGLPLAIQLLATPLGLAVIPVLGVGLFLNRQIPHDEKLEGHRTVATTIALLGVLLQLAALVLAWPQPVLIAFVGILAAGCLAYMALRFDFPLAHAGAMVGVALAYLAVFFIFRENKFSELQSDSLLIDSATLGKELLNFVLSAKCGTALGGLFAVFALISEYFVRRGQKKHGACYAAGSCSVAVLGLMLVTVHGLRGIFFANAHGISDGIRATILYSLYGIVSMLFSWRWKRKELSYMGGNLLAIAPFWLLHSISLAVWTDDLALAGCVLWVAVVWLTLAWQHRSAVMMTLTQIMLSVAGLVAMFAWLICQGWITTVNPPGVFGKVYNLQAFGVALAATSLLWMIVRVVLRGNEQMQKLLNPAWLMVDKIVGSGLVIIQFIVLLPFVLNGIGHEIQPITTVSFQDYCGPIAWLLIGLLGAINLISLWDRWEKSHLLCGLILATSVSCLVAGYFTPLVANAAALRWGLAITFVVVSVAIWCRERIHRRLIACGAKIELAANSALFARIATALLTAVPVVAITVFMAMTQLQGTTVIGPMKGSIFYKMGPNLSYLVPLGLVIVATVGHALRESSSINAFLAGMVVELAVMLGYPLYLKTNSLPWDPGEFLAWIQLMTIAAAIWSIIWLIARRWVNVWREVAKSISSPKMAPRLISSTLMNVQLGFGALGNIVLLGIALLEIIFTQNLEHFAQAGMPLGWCALGLTVAAGGYRAWQRSRCFSPNAVGMVGLSVLGLLACTLPNLRMLEGVALGVGLPYRVLMIGWASYALMIAVGAWMVASQRTQAGAEGPPQAILRLASVWVRVAGIAAVLLGMKAGFLHDDIDGERLWAAAGIAIASVAGATMAVWRRREGWAFCAALGVNLASSLVVWHVEEVRNIPFDDWWLRLVQANVIASSLVALVWLAAHRRLYQLRVWSVQQSPLLSLQILLPVVANAAILVIPVVSLLQNPLSLRALMHDFADAPGWLGLVLTSVAGAWFLQRMMPDKLVHALAGFGLGAGVLIACGSHSFGFLAGGEWSEYHLLLASWTAAAVILLIMTFVANTWHVLGKRENGTQFISINEAKMWISAFSMLAAALVVRSCSEDLGGVWWSLVAVAVLVFTTGTIAVWLRSAAHVVFSGLLVNLAGVAAWFAFGERNPANFLEFQVFCLTATAAIWTLLDILRRDCVPHFNITIGGDKDQTALPFAHLAISVAIAFLAVPTVYGVIGDLNGFEHDAIGRLGWIALATIGVVLTMMLWDLRARYAWLGFYLTGIIAFAMHWVDMALSHNMLIWRAGCDLAAYVIIAALIGRFMPALRHASRYLLIPDGKNRWAGDWFTPLQAILIGVDALLCVWIAIDFRFCNLGMDVAFFGLGGSYAGATGLLMLLGATILMAAQNDKNIREYWQFAAFVAGLLFMASVRLAMLNPEDPLIVSVPWLHRSISLLVSAAMMCMLASFGLPQVAKRFWAPLFPQNPANPKSTWSDVGRKILPYFAGLTLLMLAIVLIQEGYHRAPNGGVPEALAETLIVAGIMAALLVLALVFAIKKDLDPLKLSENGRQAYVYAAEMLVALIWLHIWLTHPDLLRLHIMRKYWMFILMAVAYAGAGLSEIFHRLKMPVLSKPLERTALFLPVLPVLGFWLVTTPPYASLTWGLIGRSPWLWFFIASFYGTMAYMRRSPICGVLAILTGNMGIWTALMLGDITFFTSPQLWLIPIALCALVAEFMNHDRLSKTQSTVFRYAALSTIYISSTADIFLAGIGHSFLLPMVLLAIALAGSLLGVFLRIRSFLIMGVVFLVLDIITLIRTAQVVLDQSWPWIVSIILLGLAIIAVFGFFEKRRNDVLAAMEKLKTWER